MLLLHGVGPVIMLHHRRLTVALAAAAQRRTGLCMNVRNLASVTRRYGDFVVDNVRRCHARIVSLNLAESHANSARREPSEVSSPSERRHLSDGGGWLLANSRYLMESRKGLSVCAGKASGAALTLWILWNAWLSWPIDSSFEKELSLSPERAHSGLTCPPAAPPKQKTIPIHSHIVGGFSRRRQFTSSPPPCCERASPSPRKSALSNSTTLNGALSALRSILP